MGSTPCVKPCERGVVRCNVFSCCEPTANLPISFSKRGANIFLFILNRLDGVEDPHNLGAVLRTAEAAGVHGVFIPERRAVGLTPVVAKVSAGALDHMRVGRVVNLSRLIEELKGDGVWVYGVEPSAQTDVTTIDMTGPVAFVFGGEGGGIRQGVLQECDGRVRIPMKGKVESLNVSAAVAVTLFEGVRQRSATAVTQRPIEPE
jgi:23S rRNA (guanosine2251-2'-O)-methyltransferase